MPSDNKDKYVYPVDVMVLKGPHYAYPEHEESDQWLVGIDMGLSPGDEGFQERKALAYKVNRDLKNHLTEAGYSITRDFHYDYKQEHLFISLASTKKDGSLVTAPELKLLVARAVNAYSAEHFKEDSPLRFIGNHSWEMLDRMELKSSYGKSGWAL